MFFQNSDMYSQRGAGNKKGVGNTQGSFRGGAFEGWLNCHEESAIITPTAKILRKSRDHTTFPFAANRENGALYWARAGSWSNIIPNNPLTP
jgi:hypothetical protein